MPALTDELFQLKWPKNYTRKNILNEGDKNYEGFVLGIVWSWAHTKTSLEPGRCLRPSQHTKNPKNAKVYELAKEIAEFEFTTIQFNKNYQCAKHIDGNNVGISRIIGLGDYEGGELLVYFDGPDEAPTVIDIKNKFYEFNGSEYWHETAPFTGTRFSLVYFSLE